MMEFDLVLGLCTLLRPLAAGVPDMCQNTEQAASISTIYMYEGKDIHIWLPTGFSKS